MFKGIRCHNCGGYHRASLCLDHRIPPEGTAVFTKGAFWGLLLILLCTLLTFSCGGEEGAKELDIADIGWTENTAVAHLTKVLLEEELGYEEVIIHTYALDSVYDSVAKGDLDAFQDVWLPNQRGLLESVEGDVVQLSYSYQGQTKQGIAVPSYMDTRSLDQLDDSNADLILGIEPSSVVMGKIHDEVVPAYGLRQKLVGGPTEGMLKEVDERYRNREEFALVAWSPHWMNQRYDLRYLEDPKNAFGELNEPARISTIVNEDLPERDPQATAFMDALILDEEQLGELESAIENAGDPHEGAIEWVEENREVWQPWVEAAQNTQEE